MALLKDMEPVMIQRGFYDTEDHFNKLDEKDPLPKLNESINWSIFRPLLNKTKKSDKKKNRPAIVRRYCNVQSVSSSTSL